MSITIFMQRLCLSRVSIQISLDIVLYLSTGLFLLFLFLRGVPYEKGFFCDDVTLSYPYKPDTISTSLLIAVGFGISALTLAIVEILNCIDRGRRTCCPTVGDVLYCMKGYGLFLVGFVIQQLITEIVKNQFGALRPNFFDLCHPSFNRTLCPGYISEYHCTNSDYEADDILDSRKSFPSGHASFSMYIAFYFCTLLLILSVVCGMGRIINNKHHLSDVFAGFGLGIVVAGALFICVGQKILTNKKTYLEKETQQNAYMTPCSYCYLPNTELESQVSVQDTELKSQTSVLLLSQD